MSRLNNPREITQRNLIRKVHRGMGELMYTAVLMRARREDYRLEKVSKSF